MITPAYVRMMADYNRWQNRNLYGTADQLTDQQRKEQRGAFFGSIHGTLNHLVWGDQIWMSRFAGTPRPKAPSIPESPAMYDSWEELEARARRLRRGHHRLGREARPGLARRRSHLVLGRQQARRDEAQGHACGAHVQPPDAPSRPGALHADAVRRQARRHRPALPAHLSRRTPRARSIARRSERRIRQGEMRPCAGSGSRTRASTAYGILEGDRIAEVAGDPFAGYERTSRIHDLAAVKIEVPVVPPTFYCVGLNYCRARAHAAAKLGIKRRTCPSSPTSATAPPTRSSPTTSRWSFPAMPPRCSTRASSSSSSASAPRTCPRPRRCPACSATPSATTSASAPGRSPTARCGGPRTPTPSSRWARGSRPTSTSRRWRRACASTAQETTRFPTNAMIFGVAAYIAAITRYITLVPGDILWMGTDGTSPDLKAGDTVEVEITGLGILRNRSSTPRKADVRKSDGSAPRLLPEGC